MRAVCPIWSSTCCASVTPGMETEIWFFPVVCTCAPDTPRPLTRRFKMLTVSSRSACETCCPSAVYTTDTPPARSSPKRGDHLAANTAANEPSAIATTTSTLIQRLRR